MTDFEKYELMLGQIITLFQLIEHDLKCILLLISSDFSKYKIDKFPLGKVVETIAAQQQKFFSADDYVFLKALTEKRNYYCHQCIVDFLYQNDFINSDVFKNSFNSLKEDYNIMTKLQHQTENIRINLALEKLQK